MISFLLQNDCSELLFTSDPIQAYYANPETAPISITLTCGESSYEFEIDDLSSQWFEENDITYIKVTPEDFDTENKIEDGVYKVKAVIPTNTGNITQSACVFIGCNLRCLLIEHLASYPQSEAFKFEMALQWLNKCDTCSCDHGVIIYNYLLNLLNHGEKSPCDC